MGDRGDGTVFRKKKVELLEDLRLAERRCRRMDTE